MLLLKVVIIDIVNDLPLYWGNILKIINKYVIFQVMINLTFLALSLCNSKLSDKDKNLQILLPKNGQRDIPSLWFILFCYLIQTLIYYFHFSCLSVMLYGWNVIFSAAIGGRLLIYLFFVVEDTDKKIKFTLVIK